MFITSGINHRHRLRRSSSGFKLNKDPIAQAGGLSKEEEKKEVLVRGLPPGGVVIASGDNFGMKEFSAKELEVAIRHGVALEAAPARATQSSPWGRGCVGVHSLNLLFLSN